MEVVGLDNFSTYYSPQLKKRNAVEIQKIGVEVINGDLRDISLFGQLPRDFNFIVHFAAQPGISAVTEFKDYLENNFIATKLLSDFAEKNTKLNLFINISTSSVYGLFANKDESFPPEPASYYGITKLAAEQLILERSRNKIYPACSLRLFSVYGPRERPEKLCHKLIDSAINNRPFSLFEGSWNHKRSFTFVDDISMGILKAIEKEQNIDGEVINLGSEQEYQTSEVVFKTEELTGKKITIVDAPARFGDQQQTVAKIEKAKNLLSYVPSTTLEEGLLKQMNWYKKHFH